MRTGEATVGVLACALALGCGRREQDDSGSEEGSWTGPSSTGSTSGSGEATGDEEEDGDGGRLDVGGGDGTSGGSGAEGGESGCKKVDFLFTIDSSNSMATNQAQLIASFPEFVQTIQDTLATVQSYHVGIVTSDPYAFNAPGCTTAGALVTQTGGKESSMAVCNPYADGFRYMTERDDLATKFACAGQVGTGGENDERMMLGAGRAVMADMNAAGACNEGFVRDDALLVLVLITDEDDPGTCVNGNMSCQGSSGNPAEWYQGFVDIKGTADNVVALSLTRGAPGNACSSAQGTEKNGDRIMQFVQMFGGHGLLGDICANSFGPFFDEAVGLIQSACADFVPPS